MNLTKISEMPVPEKGEAFRAYLAMMWILSGGLVVFAVFATSPADLTLSNFMAYLPGCLLGVCLFPFMVSAAAISGLVSLLIFHDYTTCAACAGVVLASLLLWWAVWYVLYGRHSAKP